MAYSKVLVADMIVEPLIESQNLFGIATNRAFDSLVKVGASSVDVPDLAIPEVRTTGTTSTASERKDSHDDVTMINIPLSVKAVPLSNKILGQYESEGFIAKQYLQLATRAYEQYFDTQVITAAQGGTQTRFIGSEMSWADLTGIKKRMDIAKVPQQDRFLVVDANLYDEFLSLEPVKTAMAFQRDYLAKGLVPEILGFKVYNSGLVGTVVGDDAGAHTNITAWYGPGIAFVLNHYGEVKEVYDNANLKDVTDIIAYSGIKLLKTAFAQTIYKS